MSKWTENSYSYVSEDGIHYDSPKNAFWISTLGFCGCYSESLFDLAWDIFNKMYKAKIAEEGFYYEYENKSDEYEDLQELLLHVFHQKDLTEHGSSVRGGWMTEKGFKIAHKLITDYEAGPSK